MTPSITACPPTIKSLSVVLNVFFLWDSHSCLSVFSKTDRNVCPTIKTLTPALAAVAGVGLKHG
jgi:hypothetical protein